MAQPTIGAPEGHNTSLETTVALVNKAGLHARSAAMVVKATARFQSAITLDVDGRHANARSLIELLKLGAREGHMVRIHVEGHDAHDALHEIKSLVERGFDEE